ncbi:MAG TPA: transposase, partial [Gammaproteobacteria bacterium]|nr:transposase [Gammaproteobacteria bacterium]
MPRPLRIEFENACYHVMNRGAGQRKIYKTSFHRNKFIELLGESNKLFGIEIHAYCLMDNHYHLLVKTPHANLSRAMRH